MRSIPVTILAGSDRRPAHLPEGTSELHPLMSFKAARLRPGGRPLIVHLVERLSGVSGLGPVLVAGPARVYEPLVPGVRVLDTDDTVGVNLRRAIERHVASAGGPMAILACDVLPDSAELALLRERYERDAPCALWMPFVRVPADPRALGAFAWKPTYRLRQADGAEPVRILPGHLGIVEPAALRLNLLYRLLDLAYRSRNRSIAARRLVMVRSLLASLVLRDLLELARLRAPRFTAEIVGSGLRLARELRAGRLALDELERLTGRILLHRAHAGASVRLPVTDFVSLAEDIDTEEEARELETQLYPETRGSAQ
jgi:hypothetical protein